MRRKLISALVIFSLAACVAAHGESDKKEDPNKIFYAGNSLYEKQNYAKAAEEYAKLRSLGLESGEAYYNAGNSFFKLGKLGYAILNYERARRIIPHDRDLRANLAYAKSLVGSSAFELPQKNFIVGALKAPFRDVNLTVVAIITSVLYILVVALAALFALNPFLAKRLLFIFVLIGLLFAVSSTALIIRYYDEEMLKWAVVVVKEADCKYEPIDKSTTYYKLQEGDEAIVLKEREGWYQIRRIDGKIAWVKKNAIEEI